MGTETGSTLPPQSRFFDLGQEPTQILLPIEGYELTKLVTLEEAVQPLLSIVNDLPRRVWICKSNCKHPADSLTSDESASIQLYTLEWAPSEKSLYYILNSTLRDKNRDKLKPWFSYLKLFLTGLYKLPSVQATIWRGIKGDISQQFEKDGTFVWWGLSSCTDSIDILQSSQFLGTTGARTLISIECINGKMIKRHSIYDGENEILLMPASYFQVCGKINSGHGLNIIHVKEIEPPFPLIQPPFEGAGKRTPSNQSKEKWNKEAIVAALAELTTNIIFLDLSQKKITDDGLKPLAEALQKSSCSLKNIELEQNQISVDGCKILCEAIETNTSLTSLDLLGNQIGDEGAMIFADLLKMNSSLKDFDLAFNSISDSGAKALGESLKLNTTLTLLDIYGNDIGSDGGVAIAEALKVNHSLKTLSLFKNRIGDKGTVAIAESLKINKVLVTLNLGANLIADEGAVAISNALKANTSLTNLCLDVNEIGDEGTIAMAEALKVNKTLTSLNICQNRFSDASRKTLAKAAKVHRTLVNLFFN
ncbi:unnamed protein product [Rotaria sp. Silwood1]|nr:unnamed protein product [Rotaria sp. Silwood1]CAF4912903.1 unnamed protein product [Rotaria sp. Silwood1]CAF5034120.1 unnamed protein product [Rotaria sp. Silwood1]